MDHIAGPILNNVSAYALKGENFACIPQKREEADFHHPIIGRVFFDLTALETRNAW